MSNATSSGDGFHPIKHKDGREYTGSGETLCYVPSTDGTALYKGDVVTLVGTTNSSAIVASGAMGSNVGFLTGQLPVVTQASAGTSDLIYGVVTGIEWDPSDVFRPAYRKASTATIIRICSDPDVIFEARILNLTTAITSSQVAGATLNLYLGSGGSTTTGVSSMGLDGSAIQTSSGSTYQFRILQLSRDPLNSDITSANPKVYCLINQSSEKTMGLTAI